MLSATSQTMPTSTNISFLYLNKVSCGSECMEGKELTQSIRKSQTYAKNINHNLGKQCERVRGQCNGQLFQKFGFTGKVFLVQDSQWPARIYLMVILWAMCTCHVTFLHPTPYPKTNIILQRPNLNPRPTLHISPNLKLSFEFSQKPMSRSMQLNYISVTAFSQTDLFLDLISFE